MSCFIKKSSLISHPVASQRHSCIS